MKSGSKPKPSATPVEKPKTPAQPPAKKRRTPRARKVGRPSKYTLGAAKKICRAIAAGLPFKYAAALVGISSETLNAWRKQFPEFSDAIQQAVAAGIASRLTRIVRASYKDHKAAAWWLEHVFPEHFARNRIEMKHDHTGSIQNTFVPAVVQIEHEPYDLEALSVDELRTLRDLLKKCERPNTPPGQTIISIPSNGREQNP